MATDTEILELVRAEATKFGRCCDLHQDGFGTFADIECQQRTFAMLRGVQEVLGVNKGGNPLTEEEVIKARKNAILRNAAPELLAELEAMVEHYTQLAGCGDCGNWNPEEEPRVIAARAAIAKATA